ncbi:MAG: AAA family ATPase [Gammaproteobacteria bacterium]|nr:AAA family ATPase [Gammaproteobacteria bacterium]
MQVVETTIGTNPTATRHHLTTLFQRCPEEYSGGLMEIRCIHPTRKNQTGVKLVKAHQFKAIDEISAAVDWAMEMNGQGFNVYVGVNPRKADTPSFSAASAKDVEIAFFNFADIDSAESVTILRGDIPIPYTFAVVTGTVPGPRPHVYWELETPVQNLKAWGDVQSGMKDYFHSDAVIDPPRVMRLAGTINYPDPKKAEERGYVTETVTIRTEYDDDRDPVPPVIMHNSFAQYKNAVTETPSTLTTPSAADPLALGITANVDVVACVHNIAAGNEWHNNMIRVVAHWISRGLSDAEIVLICRSLTLPGYTTDQTDREVMVAISGARNKYQVPNPSYEIGKTVIAPPVFPQLTAWTANQYKGKAAEMEWLCEGSVPRGVPVLFAAMGGLGKSFMGLDLGLEIAVGVTSEEKKQKTILGGKVLRRGTAVIISAEDGKDSIHRRLEAIDPWGRRNTALEKLIIVPLPDAGGPMPLITMGPTGPMKTPAFDDMVAQLKAIGDVEVVVVDPLQAFVMADVTSDPAAGQFMWSAFAEICALTRATLIVTHHMRKDGLTSIETIEDAREAIRGSTALVDGSRLTYALWKSREDAAKVLCDALNLQYDNGKVVNGAVVKANDETNKNIQTYIREESGLLVDKTAMSNEAMGMRNRISVEKVNEFFNLVNQRWADQNPYGRTPQTADRYIVTHLMKFMGIQKRTADGYVASWFDNGHLVEEIFDRHSKKNGIHSPKKIITEVSQ